MFVRKLPLFAEADAAGGAAVADPPAPAAAPPTPAEPGTPPASEPPSQPVTPSINGVPILDTPPVEAVTGSEEVSPPASDPAQPAKADPEALRALALAHQEDLLQIPEIRERILREVQSGTDRTIQQFMASPQADEQYREFEGTANTAAARLADTYQRLHAGELELDEQVSGQLAQDTYTVVQYRTEQERRAAYHSLDTRIEQHVADVLADTAGLDPGLLDLADTQSAEARQLFDRMSKANLKNGQPDERTRKQAAGVYHDRMLAAHANIWLAEGMRRQAKTYEAQRQADILITRETARREAEATQQATGLPPTPGSPEPTTRPALNADTLLKGSWQDAAKVFEAAGHKIR